jgi:hypothetical protein
VVAVKVDNVVMGTPCVDVSQILFSIPWITVHIKITASATASSRRIIGLPAASAERHRESRAGGKQFIVPKHRASRGYSESMA